MLLCAFWNPALDRPLYALRYMTRFRCIADRCEDTCCAGMHVLVSDENRSALERSLESVPGGREEVAQKVIPTPGPVHGLHWMFDRDEQGRCRFLQRDQLCS